MIKINLLPEAKVALARKPAIIPAAVPAENINNYLLIGFLVLGVLIGGYLWLSKNSKKAQLQAKVQEAEQQRDSLKQFIDQVNEFEKKKQNLEKKLSIIEELRANQAGPVHIMDEIASLIPDLLWLTSIDWKGTKLEIKGNVFNPNAVSEFLQRLDESPYFYEPILKEVKEVKDYYNFSLSVDFTFTPQQKAGEGKKGA